MSLLVSASSPSPLFARSPNGLTGFGVGENFEQPDRAVTQSDQSLHPSESLTTQVEIFEEYLSPQERFDDMFEIARVQDPTKTRQPRSNLAHDLVLQHCDGEIFGPHQDQCHLAELNSTYGVSSRKVGRYIFNFLTWGITVITVVFCSTRLVRTIGIV